MANPLYTAVNVIVSILHEDSNCAPHKRITSRFIRAMAIQKAATTEGLNTSNLTKDNVKFVRHLASGLMCCISTASVPWCCHRTAQHVTSGSQGTDLTWVSSDPVRLFNLEHLTRLKDGKQKVRKQIKNE